MLFSLYDKAHATTAKTATVFIIRQLVSLHNVNCNQQLNIAN